MTKDDDNIFIYRIDENDNIVYVNESWDKFALENEATETCFQTFLLNKPIWDFIADRETIHLYKLVVNQVRAKKKTANIAIMCDSPDLRRYVQITVKPYLEKQVEFESKITQSEERSPLDILSKDAARSEELVRICSYCKKIAVSENNWIDTEKAIESLKLFQKNKVPMLTHGVCPACYESVMTELK